MAAMAYVDRPWQLHATGGAAAPMLRFGKHAVPVSEIDGYSFTVRHDWDVQGQLCNFAVYLVIACIFLFLVIYGEWRDRFYLAVGCFAALGMMSLADVFTTRTLPVYEVALSQRSGETSVFSTAELDEAQALCAALSERGARRTRL